jgi:hypothetical protein
MSVSFRESDSDPEISPRRLVGLPERPRARQPQPPLLRLRPADLRLLQPGLGRRRRAAPPGRTLPPPHRRRHRWPLPQGHRAGQPPGRVDRQAQRGHHRPAAGGTGRRAAVRDTEEPIERGSRRLLRTRLPGGLPVTHARAFATAAAYGVRSDHLSGCPNE